MTGHTTYRLEGTRIHVTPYARAQMDVETHRRMVERMVLARVVEVSAGASTPRGPYFVRIEDDEPVRGRTLLSALDKALAARREAGL